MTPPSATCAAGHCKAKGMDMNSEVSLMSANELNELEAVIDRGKLAFVEVGMALMAIREKRGYRLAEIVREKKAEDTLEELSSYPGFRFPGDNVRQDEMDYTYTVKRTEATERVADTLKATLTPLAVHKNKWTITLKTYSRMTHEVVGKMMCEVER